jgi:hypothetical protein
MMVFGVNTVCPCGAINSDSYDNGCGGSYDALKIKRRLATPDPSSVGVDVKRFITRPETRSVESYSIKQHESLSVVFFREMWQDP